MYFKANRHFKIFFWTNLRATFGPFFLRDLRFEGAVEEYNNQSSTAGCCKTANLQDHDAPKNSDNNKNENTQFSQSMKEKCHDIEMQMKHPFPATIYTF